jgi:preprotein translocase subunit SecE
MKFFALSRNHCCQGNATMFFFNIVAELKKIFFTL